MKLIAIWPRTLEELNEVVVNRTRGVIWPTTQMTIADEEPVLLDVRIPDSGGHIVLRASGRYTIPERHGPMFVCHKDDLPQFAAVVAAIEKSVMNARLFPRYPAAIPATVRIADGTTMRARVLDLSFAGARLEVEGELPEGAEVIMEMSQTDASTLPSSLTGRILGGRRGGVAMHFAGPNFDAWRQVRCALRRASETGVAPSLGQ